MRAKYLAHVFFPWHFYFLSVDASFCTVRELCDTLVSQCLKMLSASVKRLR